MKIRIFKRYGHWFTKDRDEGAFAWNTWKEALDDAIWIAYERPKRVNGS